MNKFFLPNLHNCRIAIIGLGYVGLPLAIEFAKKTICCKTKVSLNRKVIGFDTNLERLKDLENFYDKTYQISKEDLKSTKNIIYTNNIDNLSDAEVFIITVPTPIDKNKIPDLSFLESASSKVGEAINRNKNRKNSIHTSPIIIYESTVYPGTTEEFCVPIIQEKSGLEYNNKKKNYGFFCGYSPERINPSDKLHTINSITKVTSGSNPTVAKWINTLYESIIDAGTHLAPSIKVAEASKVIENTQRDLNIALVNELAIIFDRMNLDTRDVLSAASTKWNFMKFFPGLVGGHCIGVDPYYLTFKSQVLGYEPKVVLAGRNINDNMSKWIVQKLIKNMLSKSILKKRTKILIVGFTFKADCNDIRNTKVFDIIKELKEHNIGFDIVDPLANEKEVKKEYNFKIHNHFLPNRKYDSVIVAVGHKEFKTITNKEWLSILDKDGIIFDLQNIIPRELNPLRM